MPANSHHYNLSNLLLKFLKELIVLCIVSKPHPEADPRPKKKQTPYITDPSEEMDLKD